MSVETLKNTFRKAERLCRKTTIEQLFAGGNASMAVFPLRVVYMPMPATEAPVSVMVSVSKRRFRHAVDRNRMKRQVREAYRLNKHGLCRVMQQRGESLAVAFICLASTPCNSSAVEHSVKKLLSRMEEKLGGGER